MATPSSILAWRIPWTEEPGRLQSMGLQRIGYGWAMNTFTFSSYIYGPFFPFIGGKWSRVPQRSHSIGFYSCTFLAGDPGQTTLTFWTTVFSFNSTERNHNTSSDTSYGLQIRWCLSAHGKCIGIAPISIKKMLAYNSACKKLRSWHPVPSFHGK